MKPSKVTSGRHLIKRFINLFILPENRHTSAPKTTENFVIEKIQEFTIFTLLVERKFKSFTVNTRIHDYGICVNVTLSL